MSGRMVPQEGQDLVSFIYDNAFYFPSQNIQYVIPKGVLYKIKNASSDTIGYLMGSPHAWLPDWECLSPQVINALRKSNQIFFEHQTCLPTIPESARCRMLIEHAILQHVNGKNVVYLEDPPDSTKTPKSGSMSNTDNEIDAELESMKSPSYAALRAWEEGDEHKIIEEHKKIHDCFVLKNRWNDLYCLAGKRTKQWFDDHLLDLLRTASSADKFFICVGAGHIYDLCGGAEHSCATCATSNLGLLTFFKQVGNSYIRV